MSLKCKCTCHILNELGFSKVKPHKCCMKIKLFIDDVRDAPEGWKLCRTITDAINFLNIFDASEISLDHDITHRIPSGKDRYDYSFIACSENYSAVACFIAQKYYYANDEDRPKIVLHSGNPVGVSRMSGILKDFNVTIK